MSTIRNKELTLLAACLAFVLVLLDVSVLNVALHYFETEFQTDSLQLRWVVSAYPLLLTSLLHAGGELGSRFGHKKIFMWGYVVFTLASLGCGLAGTLPVFTGFRALQGIGGALLVPTSFALVRITFEVPAERNKAIALWAGVAGIALAAGPVVGESLIDVLGWRGIFFINLPIGLIGIVLCLANSPTVPAKHNGDCDLRMQALAFFTLANLTCAVIELGRVRGADLRVALHAACFIVGLSGLLWYGSRTRRQVVPLSVLFNAAFSLASLLGVIVNFVFYGLVFVFIMFLQQVKHFPVINTGVAFVSMTAILFFGNQLAVQWIPALGLRRFLVLEFFLALLGVVALTPFLGGAPYAYSALQMFVVGFGISLTVPILTTTTASCGGSENPAVTSVIANSARQIGGLMGMGILSLLINATDIAQHCQGYAQVIVLFSLVLALSWVLTLLLLRN